MKNVGNSSRGRSQGVPKIFRAPMYRAHCAVIFAIAQLSCIIYLLFAVVGVVVAAAAGGGGSIAALMGSPSVDLRNPWDWIRARVNAVGPTSIDVFFQEILIIGANVFSLYVRPHFEFKCQSLLKQDTDAILRVQRRFTKRLRDFQNYNLQ